MRWKRVQEIREELLTEKLDKYQNKYIMFFVTLGVQSNNIDLTIFPKNNVY